MSIFNTTAAGLGKDVDTAMSAFKSTIEKLKTTADKANSSKAEKQSEIKQLEAECSALDGVTARATNLASKLEALFE